MKCPKCAGKTKVARTFVLQNTVARVRKCQNCGHSFSTTEKGTPTEENDLEDIPIS